MSTSAQPILRSVVELFKKDPFDVDKKENVDREQVMFVFQARACAR